MFVFHHCEGRRPYRTLVDGQEPTHALLADSRFVPNRHFESVLTTGSLKGLGQFDRTQGRLRFIHPIPGRKNSLGNFNKFLKTILRQIFGMNAQRRRPTFLGLLAVAIKAIRSQAQAFHQGKMGIHTCFCAGFQGLDFVSPAQALQPESRHSQGLIAAMQGIHPIRGLLLL